MYHFLGDIAALTDGCGEITFPMLGYFVRAVTVIHYRRDERVRLGFKICRHLNHQESLREHPTWMFEPVWLPKI